MPVNRLNAEVDQALKLGARTPGSPQEASHLHVDGCPMTKQNVYRMAMAITGAKLFYRTHNIEGRIFLAHRVCAPPNREFSPYYDYHNKLLNAEDSHSTREQWSDPAAPSPNYGNSGYVRSEVERAMRDMGFIMSARADVSPCADQPRLLHPVEFST